MPMTNHPSIPTIGYYWRRMVRGGPRVPVVFYIGPATDPLTGDTCERGWQMRCIVGGRANEDPLEHWTYCCGNPIDAAEYEHLLAVNDWAASHAPDEPEARLNETMDIRRAAPVGPPNNQGRT